MSMLGYIGGYSVCDDIKLKIFKNTVHCVPGRVGWGVGCTGVHVCTQKECVRVLVYSRLLV